MLLPASDGSHMPPAAMPQPTTGEIDAVRLWIARGAAADLVVDPADLSPSATQALVALLAQQPGHAGGTAGAGSHRPSPSGSADHGELPDLPRVPPMSDAGCQACSIGRGSQENHWNLLLTAMGCLVLLMRRVARPPRRKPE